MQEVYKQLEELTDTVEVYSEDNINLVIGNGLYIHKTNQICFGEQRTQFKTNGS